MKNLTLFETLRTIQDGEEYLWLDEHLERLKKSIQEVRGGDMFDTISIKEDLLTLLPFPKDQRMKIMVDPERGISFELHELIPLPVVCYQKGVSIVDVVFERPESHLKYETTVYKKYATVEDENWKETVFIDEKGFLREGNITNIFCLIEGSWVTPPAEACFPGLMRHQVLNQLGAQERPITKKEAQSATSILLTNSVKGVIPVRGWNGILFEIIQLKANF